MLQINLLPDVVLNRRREARVKQIATVALVGWILFLVFAAFTSLGYRFFQSSRLSSAKQKFTQLDASVNSEANKAFRQEASEVQTSLTAITTLINDQRKLSVINDRIAALTPKGVRLREISITSDSKVILTGTASSYAEAGKMLVAIKDSKPVKEVNSNNKSTQPVVYFANAVLEGANIADTGVSFSVTAELVYEGSG